MKTYARELTLFFTLLLACPDGHAAEQDNWYLAQDFHVADGTHDHVGVAYYENNSTGAKEIYVCKQWSSSSRIGVYELNGTLIRDITVASTRDTALDVALDENGTIYIAEEKAITCLENDGTFKWRTGKNASISNYGSSGSGNGEFNYAKGIAVGPDGNLYVCDSTNHRCQVLDKNGNFIRKFGSNGSAPGQLKSPKDIIVFEDGTVLIGDDDFLNFFMSDGTFVKRVNTDDGKQYVSVSLDGTIVNYGKLKDRDGNFIAELPFGNSRSCFTPQGDIIQSHYSSSTISLRIYKRAYRTKGLPVRNVIPQPAVRSITQRAGTNIIDLDFEIIDPDDANATVGVVAYCGGQNILPQTWVDGTGSKIGTPIATNQVHRLSWNVKPDWPDSTGTLKFEIICQDARRTFPVDLHFLTLPLPDGNLTISRSPLKDSDFVNFGKYLVSTGQVQLDSIEKPAVSIPGIESNASQVFTFTNAGATGRNGPTAEHLIEEYNGTNLQGSVTTGFQPGYQNWTVPATGTYVIEAVGARGGNQPSKEGGLGAFTRGNFSLVAGQELTIVVGQTGMDNSNDNKGASGGGGTFVVADVNNTPLVIAGGGGGAGGNQSGQDASTSSYGKDGSGADAVAGNSGQGGVGYQGGGGGGFLGSGTGHANQRGNSFQEGAKGGSNYSNGKDGGFGGGAATWTNTWTQGGGGGGYSGGGGSWSHEGGGGGSFNSGSNQLNLASVGKSNGYVRIYNADGVTASFPKYYLLDKNWDFHGGLVVKLLESLGAGYRIATPEEVQKAREAATAGGVNRWTANRPIQPRNLPNKVNEYGFDTGDHGNRAWWVVQE